MERASFPAIGLAGSDLGFSDVSIVDGKAVRMRAEHADHAVEVAQGKRFEFGKNWAKFLADLDDSRIAEAVSSLQNMLGVSDLNGRTFLDVGSGSGLFSLAARKLGATVFSFDFDPHSVACTQDLKRRYFPQD